jgi:hypothetical protein
LGAAARDAAAGCPFGPAGRGVAVFCPSGDAAGGAAVVTGSGAAARGAEPVGAEARGAKASCPSGAEGKDAMAAGVIASGEPQAHHIDEEWLHGRQGEHSAWRCRRRAPAGVGHESAALPHALARHAPCASAHRRRSLRAPRLRANAGSAHEGKEQRTSR